MARCRSRNLDVSDAKSRSHSVATARIEATAKLGAIKTVTSHFVSRRTLLSGLSVLVFPAVAGCSGHSSSQAAAATDPTGTFNPVPVTPVGIPVGPGGSWTGAAGSGYAGAVPQDPVRVTAKPALQWWTPSRQRISSDTVIGVDADALGGVAYVDFYIEGSVQRATQTRYDDIDVNGKPRSRVGYWVTLSNAAFVAKAPAGAANIYAKATANDATMQARVIGPLVVFPRGAGVAWSKTVKPSGGGDFTSLAAARAQFLIDQPESAEIILAETATYDLPVYTNLFTGHTGYLVMRAAPGVTATLTRGTSFTGAPAGSIGAWEYAWNWMPFCGPIEFRGSGIVLDFKNWCSLMVFGPSPHWFNGCTLTNSAGRDQLSWNRQPHPGVKFLDNSVSGIDSYFTDVTVSYVSGLGGAMLTGMKAHDAWANHDQCRFIAGCYETGIDPSFFFTAVNAISVAYNGAGAATIVADQNGRTLDCRIDGVSVGGAFPLRFTCDQYGQRPTDTYYDMGAVAAAISGIPGGAWSASVVDRSRAGVALLDAVGTHTVTAAPSFLPARFDLHTEWCHIISGYPVENLIHRDNIVRRSYYTTSIWNAEGVLRDAIIKGNVWECSRPSGLNGGFRGQHVVVANNHYDGPLQIGAAAYWDNYGLVAQNASSGMSQAGGWAAAPPKKDNITVGTVPAGFNDTGNISLADYLAFTALVTDKIGGNFAPASQLANNPRPRIDVFDGIVGPRASSDAIGPWRIGAAAPSYPF